LGGSITFGSGTSDNEHTYSALLEEYLDEQIDKATFADYSIEVVNAGIPGLRADSLLIYLKEKVLELKPDIVIIFSGWNDWNYFLTQGYQVFDYQSPIYRLNMMLTENSVFYSKLRNVVTGYRAVIKGDKFKKRAFNVLRQDFFTITLSKNIKQIIEICRSNRVEPILLLQPPTLANFKVKNQSKFIERDPVFLEKKEVYPQVLKKLQEIFMDIASENKIPLIDVSKNFGSVKYGDQYFIDIIHPSHVGNKLVARGISDWFLKFHKWNLPVKQAT
jgi:lysophospholipase L1-like esterase